jgi:hypothetical protein
MNGIRKNKDIGLKRSFKEKNCDMDSVASLLFVSIHVCNILGDMAMPMVL